MQIPLKPNLLPNLETSEPQQKLAGNCTFLNKELMCVPGKLEYKSGQMTIVTFDPNFPVNLKNFKNAVVRGTQSSLLVEFEALEGDTVERQIHAIASLVAPYFDVAEDYLVNEGILSFDLDLMCPVTSRETRYTFYGVCFSNCSRNENDNLFDPPQFMPTPAILFSCDALSFAGTVRHAALKKYNALPHQLPPDLQATLFSDGIERWHKSSVATLRQFAKISDTIKIESATHWVANHRDPVFAELVKKPYRHELPSVYCAEIVRQWKETFNSEGTDLLKIIGGQAAIGEV